MADVWVLRPAGLAVAAHLATIVVLEVPAVFVQHQKRQRKNPPKEAANVRLPPKKEVNAAEQRRLEVIIAGSM